MVNVTATWGRQQDIPRQESSGLKSWAAGGPSVSLKMTLGNCNSHVKVRYTLSEPASSPSAHTWQNCSLVWPSSLTGQSPCRQRETNSSPPGSDVIRRPRDWWRVSEGKQLRSEDRALGWRATKFRTFPTSTSVHPSIQLWDSMPTWPWTEARAVLYRRTSLLTFNPAQSWAWGNRDPRLLAVQAWDPPSPSELRQAND